MLKSFEPLLLAVAYPFIMGLAIFLHFFLLASGLSLTWSVYGPILLCTVLIILLEQYFPFHKPWLPNKNDIANDLSYLVIMQALLPRLILFVVLLALAKYEILKMYPVDQLWPHDWSYLLQAVLMILIVDFSIYWIHRALHQIPFLWRFHAVHHSPHKLYWLNVGRDHPVEKICLFSFGLLPFYFLGVNEYVFGIYFVIFDIHAFFQHSNTNIKYGFFNYLISTSELHRWHHSRDVEKSEHNYGNTLSIWDVLFKTWYFPYANYYDIGLKNRNYPLGFIAQLRAPLVPDITNQDVRLLSTKELVSLYSKRLAGACKRFLGLAANPR